MYVCVWWDRSSVWADGQWPALQCQLSDLCAQRVPSHGPPSLWFAITGNGPPRVWRSRRTGGLCCPRSSPTTRSLLRYVCVQCLWPFIHDRRPDDTKPYVIEWHTSIINYYYHLIFISVLSQGSLLSLFSEWWRAAEAHGRSPPTFFPPFLGLPPIFAPPLHNHEANPYTSKTPSKSSQASKGINLSISASWKCVISLGGWLNVKQKLCRSNVAFRLVYSQ